MPEVDLTSIFTHMPTEGSDGHNASLLTLLNTVSGATISDDATLNRQLKQGAITVISVFQPNPCTAGTTHGTTGTGTGTGTSPPAETPPAQPGTDSGGELHYKPGTGAPVVYVPPAGSKIALPLREKLVALGSTFNELIALLDGGGLAGPGAGTGTGSGVATRTPTTDPKCWRYQNTTHGPTGLYRSREILKVRVNGFVETLAGLKQAQATTEWLMYMEYSVNTYLAGQAAWELDPKTNQAKPNGPVTLTATNGCFGTGGAVEGLTSCGSDSVRDVLRVTVNFKKVFLAEVAVAAQGIAVSGGLSVYVSNMQEQSFAGVMPFTHRMGAASP